MIFPVLKDIIDGIFPLLARNIKPAMTSVLLLTAFLITENSAEANACINSSASRFTVQQYEKYLVGARRSLSAVWPERGCLDFDKSNKECLDIKGPFNGGIDFNGNACVRHSSDSEKPSKFELDFTGRLDRLILRAYNYKNIKISAHDNNDRHARVLYLAKYNNNSDCVNLEEELKVRVPFESIEARVCGGSEITLMPSGWMTLYIDRNGQLTDLNLDFKFAQKPTRDNRFIKEIYLDVNEFNIWGGEKLSHAHNLGNTGFYSAGEPQWSDELSGHANSMWVKGFPNGLSIAFGAFQTDSLSIMNTRLDYVYSQSGAKSLYLKNVSISRLASGMASKDTTEVYLDRVTYPEPDDKNLVNDVALCSLIGFSEKMELFFDESSFPSLNKWITNKADELAFWPCAGSSQNTPVKLAAVLEGLLDRAKKSEYKYSPKFIKKLGCAVEHAKKPKYTRREFWGNCDPFSGG
ncbi:MAG: hypothetical protein ABW168_04280 [Sedimenticola sp.]